ncbi:unnamed protein product [Ambrosiozyma monospora]|uniref:Unnamed protein product n=1 Tax=Ambrosiozyma monospora TaxID=43982 RepID=A0A9W6WJR9_AMBMO|nr:unnamed protein product [Ambrosiozyma monospora]
MEIADPTDFRKMPKAVLDEVVSLQPYRVALENAIGIWTELPHIRCSHQELLMFRRFCELYLRLFPKKRDQTHIDSAILCS